MKPVLRVRPAGRRASKRRAGDDSLPVAWLLAESPPEAAEPTNYWLSTLPAEVALADLVHLAKIRWRIEHDYRELKTGLGLVHFEGAPSPDGTATSPSSPPPSCSSPCCGPTQKRLPGPEPLRRPARAPRPARHLDRRLHRLRTDRRHQDPGTDLTKHY